MAKKKEGRMLRSVIKEACIVLLLIILTFLSVASFNVYINRKNYVIGSSMEPTLHDGDIVYTTYMPYVFGSPEIGDIVILDVDILYDYCEKEGLLDICMIDYDNNSFKPSYFYMLKQSFMKNSSELPENAQDEAADTCWIKRVVGVEGDVLEFKDSKFYRNGELVTEEYIKDHTVITYPVDTTILIKPGMIFVMGDNRNGSRDSRSIGPVPIDIVLGKLKRVEAS